MKYQIKPKFFNAVKILVRPIQLVSNDFYIDSGIYHALVELNVLEEFSDPVWGAPTFPNEHFSDKIKLMFIVNSWAEFHNNQDKYQPDYDDDESDKYGLAIQKFFNMDERTYYNIVIVTNQVKIDHLLFDACVSSEKRAMEMLEFFEENIRETLLKDTLL